MKKGNSSGGSSSGGGRGLRYSLRRLLYCSPLMPRRLRPCQPQPLPHTPNGNGSSSSSAQQVVYHGQLRHQSLSQTQGDSQGTGGGQDRSADRNLSSSVSTVGAPYLETKLDLEEDSRDGDGLWECNLCMQELPAELCPQLSTCSHRTCYDCFQIYLRIEILESRINIACPHCPEIMHPNDIRMILNDKELYSKYEDFMVRRVLAAEPDTRWCPAPDCSYAVIASGCAGCPKIKCLRPGCGSYFCYHCKASWHPNQTCDAARAQRSPPPNALLLRSSSLSFSQDSAAAATSSALHHRDDMKPCPRCEILIVKMDDGSCNHMTCSVCAAEFCWLCMKQISDLHYLSPSGCTFWGKKPWSRKKKILWQLGTLVGAPVGIGLVAGIALPAIMIGIPVWVGRKLYGKYQHANKHKRNLIVTGGVAASVLVSPVLAGLAVSVGVPILLFYVYGVVPVSLCRSGGCGVTASPSGGVRLDFDNQVQQQQDHQQQPPSLSSSTSTSVSHHPIFTSHHGGSTLATGSLLGAQQDIDSECVNQRVCNASIGEAGSLGGSTASHIDLADTAADGESAVALAGSIASASAVVSSTLCNPSSMPYQQQQSTQQRMEVLVDITSCRRESIGSASSLDCMAPLQTAAQTVPSSTASVYDNQVIELDLKEMNIKLAEGGSHDLLKLETVVNCSDDGHTTTIVMPPVLSNSSLSIMNEADGNEEISLECVNVQIQSSA